MVLTRSDFDKLLEAIKPKPKPERRVAPIYGRKAPGSTKWERALQLVEELNQKEREAKRVARERERSNQK
jgi:hypothetical protein